jgi:hypothetical protein
MEAHPMPDLTESLLATPTQKRGLPLILVRGFGGLNVDDEKRMAYQGFNDGTVYPQKRGENYIYEGMVLRLLKSDWRYEDATNVVGYYGRPVPPDHEIPDDLKAHFPLEHFHGHKVVIDPNMALQLARRSELIRHAKLGDPLHTVWVLRYYDLGDRIFLDYAEALVRLVSFIRDLAVFCGEKEPPKVNIIAHSMGGLVVREAVQTVYARGEAEKSINKIVTLGTPHQGISFQVLGSWLPRIDARQELQHFDPDFQKDEGEPCSFKNFGACFPLDRLLTVVGTNYRSYGVRPASALNRLFSMDGEFGLNYNRSDGLVKQSSAQIPGAPRTFVHKCHGGPDSLVTSREAFEVATRFFFGDFRVRLRFIEGRVKRGQDLFGKSEFFFGVSIKPRGVDFELFHQSSEAENCYGPFREVDFKDEERPAFDWVDGEGGLVWEGWLDTSKILHDPARGVRDLVMRLDFYVGERDLLGVGFSDNVVYRKQYYVQAILHDEALPDLVLHTDERFIRQGPSEEYSKPMRVAQDGWDFEVRGTGFEGTFRVEFEKDA